MATVDVTGREDPLAKIHEQLTTAVAELARSDAWLRMLRVAARFPRYSPSNVLLIAVQRSEATNVAGLRVWNSLGRRVRKGEKGIAILAPCIYKGQQDKEIPQAPALRADDAKAEIGQRMLRGFRVVHVFDVSQTDGEPLPDVAPALLHGPAPQRLWESLVSLVERESYSLERGDCGGTPAHAESSGPTSTAALACALGRTEAPEVDGTELGVAAMSTADQSAIRFRTLRMNWVVIAGIVG